MLLEKMVWIENNGMAYGRIFSHGGGVTHIPAGVSEVAENIADALKKMDGKRFTKASAPKPKEPEKMVGHAPVGVPKTAPATK